LTAAAVLYRSSSNSQERPGDWQHLRLGPLASLFIGIAAALLGSIRHSVTPADGSGTTDATPMTKLLHEFRMDWVALSRPQPYAVDRAANRDDSAREGIRRHYPGHDRAGNQGLGNGIPKQYGADGEGSQAQLESLRLRWTREPRIGKRQLSPEHRVDCHQRGEDRQFSFDVVLEGQSGKLIESVSNAGWSGSTQFPANTESVSMPKQGNITSSSTIIDVKPGTPQALPNAADGVISDYNRRNGSARRSQVRNFNRTVTEAIGALDDRFLAPGVR